MENHQQQPQQPQLDSGVLIAEYEKYANLSTKEVIYLRALLETAHARIAELEEQLKSKK